MLAVTGPAHRFRSSPIRPDRIAFGSQRDDRPARTAPASAISVRVAGVGRSGRRHQKGRSGFEMRPPRMPTPTAHAYVGRRLQRHRRRHHASPVVKTSLPTRADSATGEVPNPAAQWRRGMASPDHRRTIRPWATSSVHTANVPGPKRKLDRGGHRMPAPTPTKPNEGAGRSGAAGSAAAPPGRQRIVALPAMLVRRRPSPEAARGSRRPRHPGPPAHTRCGPPPRRPADGQPRLDVSQ